MNRVAGAAAVATDKHPATLLPAFEQGLGKLMDTGPVRSGKHILQSPRVTGKVILPGQKSLHEFSPHLQERSVPSNAGCNNDPRLEVHQRDASR